MHAHTHTHTRAHVVDLGDCERASDRWKVASAWVRVSGPLFRQSADGARIREMQAATEVEKGIAGRLPAARTDKHTSEQGHKYTEMVTRLGGRGREGGTDHSCENTARQRGEAVWGGGVHAS